MPETLKSLVDAIDRILNSGCLDKVGIQDMINRGVEFIAGGGTRGYGVPPLPPLPLLETVFQVNTIPGQNSLVMPLTYQRNGGVQAWGGSGKMLTRYDDLLKFRKDNSQNFSKTGNVVSYCLSGKTLYYSRQASESEVINISGYRYPVKMVKDDDNPDGIPEHLQYALLTNYPAIHFWNDIDQDAGSSLHNIGKHRQFFNESLTNLDIFLKESAPAYNVEANEDQFMT